MESGRVGIPTGMGCNRIISKETLRLAATHRIYGYMKGAIFNLPWIDLYHGDNRSYKKHT